MKKFLRTFALAMSAASLVLVFCAATVPDAPSDSEKKKCPVCHNSKNPHTIFVPCNKVDKYLVNHPNDYAGECQGVSGEKPPKPSPTPKK